VGADEDLNELAGDRVMDLNYLEIIWLKTQ
jgi:hypothetical protein